MTRKFLWIPFVLIIVVLIIVAVLVWPVRFKHRGMVSTLVFSPNGSILASGSCDHTIRLWDVATGKQIKKIKTRSVPQKLDFIDNGKTLVGGGWGDPIRFWDIEIGKEKFTIPHTHIDYFVIAPKEDFIITARGDNKPIVRVWDLATRGQKYEIKGNDKHIGCLSISYDGKVIATGGGDKKVRLFDALSGKEIYKFESFENNDSVRGSIVAFSPITNVVAVGGYVLGMGVSIVQTGEIEYWKGGKAEIIILDVKTQQELIHIEEGIIGLGSFVFSPDGTKLISQGMGFQVWEVKTGKELFGFGLPTRESVETYTISPDGNILATGDYAGYIQLWDLKTGKEIKRK